jgi:putative molybdopterin biosynthesis protein
MQQGLAFIPVQDEHHDFIIPKRRLKRAAILRFCALPADPAIRKALSSLGFMA